MLRRREGQARITTARSCATMRGLTRVHAGASSLPLYWRVFATNASVLLLAFMALVLAPVTVSVPIDVGELILLAIGLLVVLLVNLLLLRPALRPLDELAEAMCRHDPLAPGERVAVDGEPDVAALAQAFNEMLDRLEFERRASARQALRVLEGERSRIARRLRPEALEDLGLQSALAALATSFSEQAQVQIERCLEASLRLSEDEELVVYRVAQEALTNVARHAQATRVELRLQQNGALTVLTVRDDGRGLSPGALPSAHGIRGMRERAMLIGAQLQVDSTPGRGTEIKLSIPFNPEAP
jgi:two-component system, NarL family, sensor histidine kinase UhpB